jgi:cobalt-zinc-cadmium efflux system outer membrane protein
MTRRRGRDRSACVVLVLSLGIAGLVACARYAPRPLDARQTAQDFSARRLDSPDLVAFAVAQPSRHGAPWPPKRFDLDDLTWVMIYYQPKLQVVRSEWAVARAGIRTAGERPNPSLHVSPTYVTSPEAGLTPWLALASLDIPIETAGKRANRIDVATHEAEAARLRLVAEAWRARSRLRVALIEWTGASVRVDTLEDKVAVDRERTALLEARFRAGEIARPDLTAGRLFGLRDEDTLALAKGSEATRRVAVAAALGVPLEAIRDLRVDPASLAPRDAAVDLADARRAALTHRADLMAALADYAAREGELRLEVAKQYPDLHLGPGYEFDQGQDKWSIGLSLELPLLNQNQGPIAEAEARRREAASRFEALQAQVIAEIEAAEADSRSSRARMAHVDALRDVAERRLAAADRSLAAGAIGRLGRDAAALEAADAAVREVDARTALRLAAGRLEDVLERPLAAMTSVGQEQPQRARRGGTP